MAAFPSTRMDLAMFSCRVPMTLGRLAMVAAITSCTAKPTSDPPADPHTPAPSTEPASPTAAAGVRTDLETLCRRVEARNVAAWSQPVYVTDQVLQLTQGVDRGDDGARCELGRLMRTHAPSVCRSVGSGLRKSCGGVPVGRDPAPGQRVEPEPVPAAPGFDPG